MILIEECILKARFWLSTLQQSSNLELVQITSTKRIYSTFDAQLCGYLVNVQIRERYENKDCTNQPLNDFRNVKPTYPTSCNRNAIRAHPLRVAIFRSMNTEL